MALIELSFAFTAVILSVIFMEIYVSKILLVISKRVIMEIILFV